ncbi:flavodoxin family protein [candidate division KSB1 bacterium]|nr:flavodoxin family protein [candidate division KSB1 bacterium]
MNVIILYDSVFGNTEKIAEAIAAEISEDYHVKLLKANDASAEQFTDIGLVIAGSPTRGFRATPAMNKLLPKLPKQALCGVKVAAFDTRISCEDIGSAILRRLVKFFGYAADPILKRLAKKGGEPIVSPEGFFVTGTEGPLKENEIERAKDWARNILAAL